MHVDTDVVSYSNRTSFFRWGWLSPLQGAQRHGRGFVTVMVWCMIPCAQQCFSGKNSLLRVQLYAHFLQNVSKLFIDLLLKRAPFSLGRGCEPPVFSIFHTQAFFRKLLHPYSAVVEVYL